MLCQMDLWVEEMAEQDKDLKEEVVTEAAEAIKAVAAAKEATATCASISAEAATGVPQRSSHWWHTSTHLKRGRM